MGVTCLKEVDLYKEIFKIIEEKRQQELNKPEEERGIWQHAPYLVFKEIGLSTSSYYEIESYISGQSIGKGKSKPLHENKLKLLCEKVGIQYKAACHLVSVP